MSSSGPPARQRLERLRAAGDQNPDALACSAEGAGQFQCVGQRHQAGTAGRGIGERAAAAKLRGDGLCGGGNGGDGGANGRGGLDLRFREAGKNGGRGLRIQPSGIPVQRFGARLAHPCSS